MTARSSSQFAYPRGRARQSSLLEVCVYLKYRLGYLERFVISTCRSRIGLSPVIYSI